MKIDTLIKQINKNIDSREVFTFKYPAKKYVCPFIDTSKLLDRKILHLKLEDVFYLTYKEQYKTWYTSIVEKDFENVPSVETLILSLPDAREVELFNIICSFKNLKNIIITDAPNLMKVYFEENSLNYRDYFKKHGSSLESFIVLDETANLFRDIMFDNFLKYDLFLENLKILKLSTDNSAKLSLYENNNSRLLFSVERNILEKSWTNFSSSML